MERSNIRCNCRRGQAMAEMVVAMIAIMMLLAGLFQITILSKLNVENIMTARGAADDVITGNTLTQGGEQFIKDWEVGPDGLRYTNDDIPDAAELGNELDKFEDELGDNLAEDPVYGNGKSLQTMMQDWRLGGRNEFTNAFSQNSLIVASELRSGISTQAVPVERVLQRLGVKKTEILLEERVFMPKLKILGEDPND